MTMSNGEQHSEPPDTPRSIRPEDRSLAERLATLEEWMAEIDGTILTAVKRRDQQHNDRVVAQQHLASEVVSLRSAVARVEDAVGQLQTDLGAIAAELSKGARQVVQIQRKLSTREVATYAVGVGGAFAIYEGLRHFVGQLLGGH